MRNFTWNRFPIKILLIDSLLTPIAKSTYLNRDMCKFESSQKDESRWQSTDSSKAYRNTSAFKCTLVEYGTRCLYEDANFYSVLIVRSASWLKLTSSHFRKCCEENFYLCVRIMQNRMEMFSTAAKLLVWRLRLKILLPWKLSKTVLLQQQPTVTDYFYFGGWDTTFCVHFVDFLWDKP